LLFFYISTVLLNASLQQEDLHFYSVLLLGCDFSKQPLNYTAFLLWFIACLEEIQLLKICLYSRRPILSINGQDNVLSEKPKFVFLFQTVVEIQCFKHTLSSFALQDFSFSGPTSAFANSA